MDNWEIEVRAAFRKKRGVSSVEVVLRQTVAGFSGNCRKCKRNDKKDFRLDKPKAFIKHLSKHVENGDHVQPVVIGAILGAVLNEGVFVPSYQFDVGELEDIIEFRYDSLDDE